MSDYFLRGILISLRQPLLPNDVHEGGWHLWFNDMKITEYLEHGVRPLDALEEVEILESAAKSSSSLVFAIVSNENQKLIGTISLKGINHIHRRAEIALVLGKDNFPGAALEAMALMTKHAFDRLNLQKLYAGQHQELWKWVNTLRTIGYVIEGYRQNYGYRNGRPYGTLLTGITAERFYELQGVRGGDVLCGDPLKTAKMRSTKNPTQHLIEFFNLLSNESVNEKNERR